ncbi:MAG: hypothetical protein Q4G60_11795 [bacterium]|nr:hypothetical protein [bacterium]
MKKIIYIILFSIVLLVTTDEHAYAGIEKPVADEIEKPGTGETGAVADSQVYLDMMVRDEQGVPKRLQPDEILYVNTAQIFIPVVPENQTKIEEPEPEESGQEKSEQEAWLYFWSADTEPETAKWQEMSDTGVRIDLQEGMHTLLFGMKDQKGQEILSRQYRICFDRTPPVLEIKSELDLEEWQREDILCEAVAADNLSDIRVIICSMQDELLWEQSRLSPQEDHRAGVSFQLERETPSDGLEFELYAADLAGNSTVIKKKYYLDKTAPQVSVAGITEGQLLATACSMDMLVSEAIYETAEAVIDISRRYEGATQVVEHTVSPLTAVQTSFTRRFDQDGVYTVSIYAKDKAGNVSEEFRLVFSVDVTAPVIRMQGPERDGRYCTEKELLIEVEEEFFENAHVSIQVKKETPGKQADYGVTPWTSLAKKTVQSYTFGEDGIYHVKVDAVDTAGHTSGSELSFLIDRNAPTTLISGMSERGITARAPALRFETEELFYNMETVTLSGSCVGMDIINMTVALPKFACTGEHSELEYAVTEEGRYLIRMQAEDAVGNRSEKQLSFIYDATPPQIGYLDTIDKSSQEKFVLPADFDRFITDLTAVQYRIYVNQQLFDEQKAITKPGKYILSVEAVDEAGNMAVETAEFIITSAQDTEFTAEADKSGGMGAAGKMHVLGKEDGATESTVSIQSSEVPLGEQMKTDMQVKNQEKMKKNMVFRICLICGILVSGAAIFGAWRYIDRKKSA